MSFEISQTEEAIKILMHPAVNIVPGSPTHSIKMKPLHKTPIAAPMLLEKYSMPKVCPEILESDLIMAELMMGTVIPNKIACGNKSVLASNHFALEFKIALSIFGRTISKRKLRINMNSL